MLLGVYKGGRNSGSLMTMHGDGLLVRHGGWKYEFSFFFFFLLVKLGTLSQSGPAHLTSMTLRRRSDELRYEGETS